MAHPRGLTRDTRARASALAAACALAGLTLSVAGLSAIYGVVTASDGPQLVALYAAALAVLAGAFLLGLATGIGSGS